MAVLSKVALLQLRNVVIGENAVSTDSLVFLTVHFFLTTQNINLVTALVSPDTPVNWNLGSLHAVEFQQLPTTLSIQAIQLRYDLNSRNSSLGVVRVVTSSNSFCFFQMF